MEENKDKHGEECGGHCCGMWQTGGKYRLLRWLLGLIIILIAFCFGYKVGEFKGTFDGFDWGKGHNWGMMYYGPDRNSYFQTRQYRKQVPTYPANLQQQPGTSTPVK